MLSELRLYVTYGYRPCHFLEALLSHRLEDAARCADHQNSRQLRHWVAYVCESAALPASCHGSAAVVSAWLNRNWAPARRRYYRALKSIKHT